MRLTSTPMAMFVAIALIQSSRICRSIWKAVTKHEQVSRTKTEHYHRMSIKAVFQTPPSIQSQVLLDGQGRDVTNATPIKIP